MTTDERALAVLAVLRNLNSAGPEEELLALIGDDPSVLLDGVRYSVALLRRLVGSPSAVADYLAQQTDAIVARMAGQR